MMADGRKGSIVPGDARSDSEQPISAHASGKKAIRPNQTLKLKKQAPKYSKPGNWREGSIIDQDGTSTPKSKSKPSKSTMDANPTPSNQEATSPGPVVTQLDDTARETFATGRPLGDSPDMVQCKHCKKTFIKGKAAKEHIQKCLEDKKEAIKRRKEAKEKAAAAKVDGEKKGKGGKASKVDGKVDKKGEEAVDADGDIDMDKDASGSDADAPGESASMSPEVFKKPAPTGLKGTKKTAGKNTADGEKKMGKKRKAEDETGKIPKKKKKDEPKPKTAKAKMPVDVERQCGVITPNGVPCARSLTCKSHSMGAKRAVPGRSLPYQMLLAAYQKKNQAKQQKAAIDANAPLEDDELATGPVDSDEETVAVMNALSKWRPQPVVPQPVLVPIKKQYQLARLREQLDNATSGGMVNIFAVKTKNGNNIGEPGAEGEGGEEDAEGERDDSFPISTAPILPQQNPLRRQSKFNLGQVPAARTSSVGAGGR